MRKFFKISLLSIAALSLFSEVQAIPDAFSVFLYSLKGGQGPFCSTACNRASCKAARVAELCGMVCEEATVKNCLRSGSVPTPVNCQQLVAQFLGRWSRSSEEDRDSTCGARSVLRGFSGPCSRQLADQLDAACAAQKAGSATSTGGAGTGQ